VQRVNANLRTIGAFQRQNNLTVGRAFQRRVDQRERLINIQRVTRCTGAEGQRGNIIAGFSRRAIIASSDILNELMQQVFLIIRRQIDVSGLLSLPSRQVVEEARPE